MVSYCYSVIPSNEADNIGVLKIVLPHMLWLERLPDLPCWEEVWKQEATGFTALGLGIHQSLFPLDKCLWSFCHFVHIL